MQVQRVRQSDRRRQPRQSLRGLVGFARRELQELSDQDDGLKGAEASARIAQTGFKQQAYLDGADPRYRLIRSQGKAEESGREESLGSQDLEVAVRLQATSVLGTDANLGLKDDSPMRKVVHCHA